MVKYEAEVGLPVRLLEMKRPARTALKRPIRVSTPAGKTMDSP